MYAGLAFNRGERPQFRVRVAVHRRQHRTARNPFTRLGTTIVASILASRAVPGQAMARRDIAATTRPVRSRPRSATTGLAGGQPTSVTETHNLPKTDHVAYKVHRIGSTLRSDIMFTYS
jgi:hypothetical protein